MSTGLVTRRGTTNGNSRGGSDDRRARRAWIVLTYESNVPGYCRCYRCGVLLYNPDALEPSVFVGRIGEIVINSTVTVELAYPLTIDRIVPGCRGGTYRRNNIRPACGTCNSETGATTRRKK